MASAIDEILVNKEIKPRYASVGYRDGAGSSSKLIGFLDYDKTYTVTLYRNHYYFIPEVNGWVYKNYINITKDLAASATQEATEESQETIYEMDEATKDQIKNFTEEEKESIYMQFVNTEYGNVMSNDAVTDTLLISDLNGVWGIPYQFPESVDPPLDENDSSRITFGYFYADRIINRMPLLIMSPGKVSFMKSYKDGQKTAILDALASSGDGNSQTVIGDFLSKPGKYYTFEYDQASYWEYVDAMNHACAVYLGIDDVEVSLNGKRGKLGSFHWKDCSNNKFDSLLNSNESYVCFYADAETTKSESFSNSTQKSQLADSVNSMSDVAKEVMFLMGAHGEADVVSWIQEQSGNINNIINDIGDIANDLLGGSTVVKELSKEFATIATGGKLIFPEIWSDSEFTQSLDVKIKLRCPCPNKVSWFLDILAPINMLIALTLPRTPYGKNILGEDYSGNPSANGYFSPFLVRAFYKGLFNCDMGIITDLSFSKGKEGSWTIDGLPSEVDVDITIKDLYNVMAMTNNNQPTEFLNNTTFLNYLANSCGISINKPDVERSIDMWMMAHSNSWRDKLTGYQFWQHATQGARNKLYNLYSGFFKG